MGRGGGGAAIYYSWRNRKASTPPFKLMRECDRPNGSGRRCVPECFGIEFERRGRATQAAVCIMDSNGRNLLNQPATCATAVRCLQCVDSAHSSITSVSFGIFSADLYTTTRFLHIGTNVKFDHTLKQLACTRAINPQNKLALCRAAEVCQQFVIKVGQDKNFNHWGFTYSRNTGHEGGENSGIFTSVDAHICMCDHANRPISLLRPQTHLQISKSHISTECCDESNVCHLRGRQ